MTSEILELQESAREVLAAEGLAAKDEKVWSLALDLGWLLIALPEQHGGLGQGLAGACAFHQEFGRGLAPASTPSAMLALDAVASSETIEVASWVERLTTQDYLAAPLADGSLKLANGRFSGTLRAVPSADRAAFVLATASDGDCVALIALNQSGVTRIARPTWDETRRLFDIELREVALDAALILARGAAAQKLARRIATQRDFALAADAVGGAEALLAMTVDYLKTRKQFSRPLALFQALKHRCADLKAQTVAAQALLADSLARVGESLDDEQAQTLAQRAKYLACTVYARVAEESLQLHGGIGMTSEHNCHLFLKRALLNQQLGSGTAREEQDIAERFLSQLASA